MTHLLTFWLSGVRAITIFTAVCHEHVVSPNIKAFQRLHGGPEPPHLSSALKQTLQRGKTTNHSFGGPETTLLSTAYDKKSYEKTNKTKESHIPIST